MTEVPKAYFTSIEKRVGKSMTFYNNLLQVTIMGNGIIYNLDADPISEVTSIENIDTLQDTDSLVNTGFIMSSSIGVV